MSSRLPTLHSNRTKIQWTDEEVFADQEQDSDLKHVVKWKKSGECPTWEKIASLSPSVKAYWAQWNFLTLESGALRRNVESQSGEQIR